MKHQTRKTISRYDRNQLLQAIQHTVTAQPYATPAHFRASTESVVGAYLRGRGVRFTAGIMLAVITEISEHAEASADNAAIWWRGWVQRTAGNDLERRTRPGSVRRYLPKKLKVENYQVNADVDLVSTGLGQQVAILGDRNSFQVFEDPAEARTFAVGLLEALNQLERENEVMDSDPIAPDYGDIAVADWDEAVRYGLVNWGEPDGESTS